MRNFLYIDQSWCGSERGSRASVLLLKDVRNFVLVISDRSTPSEQQLGLSVSNLIYAVGCVEHFHIPHRNLSQKVLS